MEVIYKLNFVPAVCSPHLCIPPFGNTVTPPASQTYPLPCRGLPPIFLHTAGVNGEAEGRCLDKARCLWLLGQEGSGWESSQAELCGSCLKAVQKELSVSETSSLSPVPTQCYFLGSGEKLNPFIMLLDIFLQLGSNCVP